MKRSGRIDRRAERETWEVSEEEPLDPVVGTEVMVGETEVKVGETEVKVGGTEVKVEEILAKGVEEEMMENAQTETGKVRRDR